MFPPTPAPPHVSTQQNRLEQAAAAHPAPVSLVRICSLPWALYLGNIRRIIKHLKEAGAPLLIRCSMLLWQDSGQRSAPLKPVGFLGGALHCRTTCDNAEAAPAFFWRAAHQQGRLSLALSAQSSSLSAQGTSWPVTREAPCWGNKLTYGLGKCSVPCYLFATHQGCQMNKSWPGRKQRDGLVNCRLAERVPRTAAR